MVNEAGEELPIESFSLIARQTIDGVNKALVELTNMGVLPEEAEVIIDSSEHLEDRFPCYVEDGVPAVIHFNGEQYADLGHKFVSDADVKDEDVSRTYIGCGITLKLLEQLVSPQEATKVDRLYTIMTAIDSICDAVRCSTFTEKDQQDQLLSLMLTDENLRCRINSLRFGIGALFISEHSRGNEEFAQRLQAALHRRMELTLARRTSYITLVEGYGYNKEQAEQMFAEQISEIELAICFPMSEQEVAGILKICAQIYGNEITGPEMVLDESEVSQGNGFQQHE